MTETVTKFDIIVKFRHAPQNFFLNFAKDNTFCNNFV